MDDLPRERLDRVVREESARIQAWLIGRLRGDFSLAEEAFQEACASALATWPRDGVPERPGAWLTRAAWRKALDRRREERARVRREAAVEPDTMEEPVTDEPVDLRIESALSDDLLRLLFTCAHPALSPEARVALTLRTLGGLTTAEIARAFLVPEATLAQRLARAQRKIRDAAIPYRVPTPAELPERLPAVLSVVYLIFNEGYAASRGDALIRRDLCALARRLAGLLAELMPTEPEVHGLRALLAFQDSRREARVDDDGVPVPLEEQDRTLWDAAAIHEGHEALRRALALAPPGPCALQAALAAEHAVARTAGETNWPRIVALYDALLLVAPGPVVELNRAAAVAMAQGPEAGLRELARVEARAGEALARYPWAHALRAELLLRCQRDEEAAQAFEEALRHAGSEPERRFLARRRATVTRPGTGPRGT